MQVRNYKSSKIEKSIQNAKARWTNNNLQQWNMMTPFINTYHKQADQKLQTQKDSNTFVTFRMRKQELPSLKQLVAPLMEEMLAEQQEIEKSQIQMIEQLEDDISNQNQLGLFNSSPEKREPVNFDTYFGDPKKMAQKKRKAAEILGEEF